MFGFISRRIAMALVVMFVVALISFLLFRFVGDPVNQMVGVETTPEQREALRQRLGLNDPVLTQFFRYVLGAVQFDFGNSYQFKQPVAADWSPSACNSGIVLCISHFCPAARHSNGRLHWPEPRFMAL